MGVLGEPRHARIRGRSWHALDVLADESQQAGAFVVGEDLGTVPPGVRQALRRRDVLSCRLFWFERAAPRRYPWRSLAAVTTHDLPTIPGVLSGGDTTDELAARLASFAPANGEDVVVDVYRALAAAPSAVVVVTIEDALGVERRPNMPGTSDPANWSRALPVLVEAMAEHRTSKRVADAMRATGRAGP